MRFFLFISVLSTSVFAKTIETNALLVHNAPQWLNHTKVETPLGRIQNYLEWDVRKISVYFHGTEEGYKAGHGLNFLTDAFFKPSDQTIHLSPRINEKNFDKIFSHELVHAVLFQKYKGAIPLWLEEGLANYIGRTSSVDYPWLSKQAIGDVTAMKHPNQASEGAKYHYSVSTALIEMIAWKCQLKDLLQLSVGAKLQTYLETYCEIRDINASFQKWVTENAANPVRGTTTLDGQSVPWWKKEKKKQWWQKDKK